jgi:predicted acetyltransferase
MRLVWPAEEHLASYVEALTRGWSPDNLRPEAAREQLDEIEADQSGFLARQVDREAKGPPITLPGGRLVPRLPGFAMWMWDGEFCGTIGFRWQAGSEELPDYVMGHIGYAVVPWKRGRGYATRALGLLLPLARAEGLEYVELTTNADNVASQRAIVANGGVVVARFRKPEAYGGAESSRFRIGLSG